MRCKIDDCNGKYKAKGLCEKHYRRVQRRGTTDIPVKPSVSDRLKLLSKINEVSGCQEWIARLSKDGYGKIDINGKSVRAHRASYQIHKGEIPKDLCVLHKCNNKKCINILHLYLGTNNDNMRDMVKDKIHSFGISHYKAKLNDSNIKDIHFLRSKGSSYKELSSKYGVSGTNIRLILSRKIWKHVEIR